MCAISGIIARDSKMPLPEEWIVRMMGLQSHRGPDDQHFVRLPGCLLGFNRLSIQDLSELGRQPMTVEGWRNVLVFNGEIYNFIELREEHKSRGVRFRSHSDSEVLLHSFLAKGDRCLNDLNGM